MKSLVAQIQPARALHLDVEATVGLLTANGEEVTVNHGSDSGPFVNITFKTVNLSDLWPRLEQLIRSTPQLSTAAIVTCEGEQGWDDYLLLHHFDSEEPLDHTPEE